MPKTLLAVDDSVTMRKVLEITFSGEDFQVITAEGHKDALAKLGEQPNVCVVDTVLHDEDGYALAKEIRKREPNATIILLSSRHAPYDQAKGKDAGADDFMDKPFDTQQMIDKVRKAVLAKEGAPAPVPAAAAPKVEAPAAAAAGAPLQRGTQLSLSGGGAGTRQRAATLMFGHEPAGAEVKVPVISPAAAAKPAERRHPTPMPTTPASTSPATVAATPAAMHAINGHLAPKLEALGLTQAQADAVLALSREVVEKAVWEVVPVLAETLIKEEIARLTKEG